MISADPPLLGLSLRLPPSNLQAEQALLGAILANNKAFHAVAEFLSPVHFADSVHGQIFKVIARGIGAGRLMDGVVLRGEFEHSGVLEEVGGTAYLAQLLSSMVGIINAREYALAIRAAWQRRQLISAGEDIVNGAFDPEQPIEEVQAHAIASIEGAFGADTDRKAVSLNDAMDGAMEAMEAARTGDGPIGLSTGFQSLDTRLGPMESDMLFVLAGRPGMGKSALGMQIAVSAARQGIGVLALSLEMSAVALGRRVLSSISGVPVGVIRSGHATHEQGAAIVLARKVLHDLPLSIEDGSGLTAAQIDLKARAAHRRHGLGFVMVDHLHIVRPEDADVRQGATWAVGRISGAMKRLAKTHRCPVLLLAQLNRGVEGRDDKRPGLADLRQAGDIEQDADAVAFVYRPEYYLKGEPERTEGESNEKHAKRVNDWREKKAAVAGVAEVIFAKIRDGEPGTVSLRFTGDTASFGEPENV